MCLIRFFYSYRCKRLSIFIFVFYLNVFIFLKRRKQIKTQDFRMKTSQISSQNVNLLVFVIVFIRKILFDDEFAFRFFRLTKIVFIFLFSYLPCLAFVSILLLLYISYFFLRIVRCTHNHTCLPMSNEPDLYVYTIIRLNVHCV